MIKGELSFNNYSHSYHLSGFSEIKALSEVSITKIVEKEIICIVGPNGSGKSTLFLAILKLIDPRDEKGFITINEFKISLDSLKLSYIPQKPADGLVQDLSIIENIVLRGLSIKWPTLKRAISDSVRDKVKSLLNDLGFDFLIKSLDMPPSSLSGGQQQVLNAVSAIYTDPDLLISDEPTSKLDEQNRIRVCQLLLHAAHSKGIRVVLTTHDLEMARTIADRIITLDQGHKISEERIREPGSPRSIPSIRFVSYFKDLKKEFQKVNQEWWKPGPENLFGMNYYLGDNSIEGYLCSRNLSLEQRTQREIKAVIRLLNIDKTKDNYIADIPCGWGRHSIELAMLGYPVTGIDLSKEYLEIAKNNIGDCKFSNLEFINEDMRNVSTVNKKFDFIINLWTSFGFFEDDDNLEVLKGFNKILKINGKVLFHSDLNPLRIKSGIFDEPTFRKLKNSDTLKVEEWFCGEDSTIYGHWELVKQKSINNYKIRIYSLEEWMRMAEKCGFKIDATYGNLDEFDSKLNNRSQEFIIILKKYRDLKLL